MPKYIIEIPEDRVTSDGKLRFMACVDSPLANWVYTGIFAEPFDRKTIEDEVWEFGMNTDWSWVSEIDTNNQNDGIRVGDEVIDKDVGKAIVTYIDFELCNTLWLDGSVSEDVPLKDLHKTGRHFDEVEELLEKMKEGDRP